MKIEREKPPEQGNELIHELYISEYQALCRTAYYLLGDYYLAEVAVQETFLTAIRSLEKLLQSEKPVGWLYNTLKFNVKHIQRDRQRLLRWTVSMDDLPEHALAHEDSYSLLDREVADSEDMRLLKEFYQEGFSLKEIAERRNISLGACKMRIKRARERMRKILG